MAFVSAMGNARANAYWEVCWAAGRRAAVAGLHAAAVGRLRILSMAGVADCSCRAAALHRTPGSACLTNLPAARPTCRPTSGGRPRTTWPCCVPSSPTSEAALGRPAWACGWRGSQGCCRQATAVEATTARRVPCWHPAVDAPHPSLLVLPCCLAQVCVAAVCGPRVPRPAHHRHLQHTPVHGALCARQRGRG